MKNQWIKLWKNMWTVQFHMFSHMLFTPFSQGQSARWAKKKIQIPNPRANKDNHMPCLSTPPAPSHRLYVDRCIRGQNYIQVKIF